MLEFAKVIGRFGVTVGDTDDPDEYPDVVWCDGGKITFTPTLDQVQVLDVGVDGGGTAVLGNAPITAEIGPNGWLTYNAQEFLWLVDLGSDSVNPNVPVDKASYRVSFRNVKAGPLTVTFADFSCHPVTGVVNDLTLLAPLPTGPSAAITRGPQGDPGPQGDRGPAGPPGDYAYISSRGSGLIANGSGYLGSNYNFPQLTYTAADRPTGAFGAFRTPTSGALTITTAEAIVVNPATVYQFSFAARQIQGTGKLYGLLSPLDADGQPIATSTYMYLAGTTTTLAQPLAPGDTTIRLTSAASWSNAAGAATWLRSMIIWNWVDGGGKAWPTGTYSRRTFANLWAGGGITGNVITLRAPWPAGNGTVAAGTPVSNASAGGSYMYLPGALVTAQTIWTDYSGRTLAGVHTDPGMSASTRFPLPTASVRAGFILNYQSSADSLQAVSNIQLTPIIT